MSRFYLVRISYAGLMLGRLTVQIVETAILVRRKTLVGTIYTRFTLHIRRAADLIFLRIAGNRACAVTRHATAAKTFAAGCSWRTGTPRYSKPHGYRPDNYHVANTQNLHDNLPLNHCYLSPPLAVIFSSRPLTVSARGSSVATELRNSP